MHIYSNAKEINYILILQRLPIIPQIEITKKVNIKMKFIFRNITHIKI